MSYSVNPICEEEYCGEEGTECPHKGKFNWNGNWKPACLAHQTVLTEDKNGRLFRCWMCKKLQQRVTEEPKGLWQKND